MYFQTSSPTIRNTRIVDNFAVRGGGAFVTYSSPAIEASVVARNGAMGEGGGLYLQTASPQLTHLTIVGNDALLGGGLYLEGASPHVTELVVAHHGMGSGWYAENSTAAIASSAVWDNLPTDFEGLTDPTGTDGNLAAAPEFLDMSAASGLEWDLHLGAGSALVDAGDPGNADPDGGPPDIGAFGGLHAGEWDLDDDGFPSWWQPGPYDPVDYPPDGWDCDDNDSSVYPGAGC
jgi:hypothetical protein